MKKGTHKIYEHLEEDSDPRILVYSLGEQTKRKLKTKGLSEPENQGYFRLNHKTVLAIPKHVKDVEEWKVKMILKYENYDKKNLCNRLSGSAVPREEIA